MTYTNTPIITSTTGLWSNANGISFSSINTIPNIPFNAQLEVERVFSSDRDGSTTVITNFLTDINVKQSDKRELFLVPNNRLTINNQTKTITAINLPSSGNDVYNFLYYKTNAPNVPETIKVPTVADNSNITIRRKTVSNIPLISWVPGSKLTSAQLNLQTTQLLYLAQELLDRIFILTTTNYSLVFNLANNTVNTLQIVDGAVTPSKISTANTPWSFNGTVSVLAPTADAHATTRLYSLNRLFEHGVMTKDDSAPSSSAIDILETAPTAGASGLWFNPKSGQLSAWAGNAWVTVAGTPVTTANLVSTNTVQTLTAAKTFAAGTVVPFTQTGTGAVARNVGAKLNEFVSVKDFGAVGDGTTNDVAALTAAFASGAKEFHFPAGTYNLGTIPKGTDNTGVFNFVSKSGIRFVADGLVTFQVAYTNSGIETTDIVFRFASCSDISFSGQFSFNDPTNTATVTLGVTALSFQPNCSRVRIEWMQFTNMLAGVATIGTPNTTNVSDFRIGMIIATNVQYPISWRNADGLEAELVCTNCQREYFLYACRNAKLTVNAINPSHVKYATIASYGINYSSVATENIEIDHCVRFDGQPWRAALQIAALPATASGQVTGFKNLKIRVHVIATGYWAFNAIGAIFIRASVDSGNDITSNAHISCVPKDCTFDVLNNGHLSHDIYCSFLTVSGQPKARATWATKNKVNNEFLRCFHNVKLYNWTPCLPTDGRSGTAARQRVSSTLMKDALC